MRPTLLYAAGCRFCCWCVALVLRWDRQTQLRPLPIESEEGQRLLERLSPELRDRSYHLVDGSGRLFSAGAATPALLRVLPGGRPPAAVLAAMPHLTERAYAALATRRARFGRLLPERSVERARALIAERSD